MSLLKNTPPVCMLCNASAAEVASAGFFQQYPQQGEMALLVDWWECRNCKGWFAYPVPTKEAILKNWGTVAYANPSLEQTFAENKHAVMQRILSGLHRLGPIDELLDIGCSTGMFLNMAQTFGWKVSGFDPNEAVAKIAQQRGFNVRQAWHSEECGYTSEQFQAVVANDVFCYSWKPFEDVQSYFRLLRPGGVLAMRISNKRFALGMSRRITTEGAIRNARLSKMLQGQYHSISLGSLARVLKQRGFHRILFESHASTAPFRDLTMKSRTAYLLADAILLATMGRVNLSPGVLVFAQKGV
jgi:SAM-dependent methyltransferase